LEWWNNATIYVDSEAIVYGRIVANRCDSLTIRGRGILCSSKENHGEGRRPQIETYACNHLTIEGIMLRDTPNWTIKVVGSDHVHVNNIKEIGWIMNSDGMDFLSCRHVLVENTFQRNYDDNVTIKAFNASPEYIRNNSETDGSYKDGTIGMVEGLDKFDVYDIEVRNCVFWADKAHNMLVGPESRGVTFSDIHFHDNIVLENRQDDDTYPGTMAVMIADNGIFKNITFENIQVEDINGGRIFCVQFTNAWAYQEKYGQNLDGITFRNISYTGKRATAARVHGLDEKHTISNVLIDNFTVNGKKVDAEDNEYISINKYVDNIEVK
jgi:polygalacturonase